MTQHSRLCEACLEKEFDTYAHARVHELIDKQKAWKEKYKINDWPRWDYELETETLTFSVDGQPRVTADIVVVGSLHGAEFEWAWGNPHMPSNSREKMSEVKRLGEERLWPNLTNLFGERTTDTAWAFVAIAAHVLSAEGSYRCPDSQNAENFMFVLAFNTRFVN